MRARHTTDRRDKTMRDEYDIENLNPRKNPYAKKLKQQVTMNIIVTTVNYFKEMAEETGIPYQTLINLCLADYVAQGKKIEIAWE